MNEKKTDNFLHLVLVLGLILLNQFTLYSQSKKKQIEILNFKIDSVNQKLANDRKIHQDEINTLINKNKELDIKRLADEKNLNQLNLENKKSNSQLDDLKSESESIIKEIEKLKDSLIRLTEEEIKKQTNFKTVEIGNQTWMVENLNVSTFRNGDPIFEARTLEEWEKAGDDQRPAWCYYYNDENNGAKYGKLYNWFAVNDSRGLAPEGWSVPNSLEWNVVINFFGGKEKAAKIIKEPNAWNLNFQESKNSQFNALPSGIREIRIKGSSGDFTELQEKAFWWTSTVNDQYSSEYISIDIKNPVQFGWHYNSVGMSVRCIKN